MEKYAYETVLLFRNIEFFGGGGGGGGGDKGRGRGGGDKAATKAAAGVPELTLVTSAVIKK